MAPALWVGQKYSGTLEGSGQLITEIRAAGGRAEILSADLAAPEGAATLAKQVWVRASTIIVANAGLILGA
jgi:short-subunit dehydrogenase